MYLFIYLFIYWNLRERPDRRPAEGLQVVIYLFIYLLIYLFIYWNLRERPDGRPAEGLQVVIYLFLSLFIHVFILTVPKTTLGHGGWGMENFWERRDGALFIMSFPGRLNTSLSWTEVKWTQL